MAPPGTDAVTSDAGYASAGAIVEVGKRAIEVFDASPDTAPPQFVSMNVTRTNRQQRSLVWRKA
jgi:hypothetical protein